MKITGNNHWINLDYDIPDWSDTDECEECFTYKNYRYFLSEFILPLGYGGNIAFKKTDTYFSGILIKFSPDYEQVKAFTFYM